MALQFDGVNDATSHGDITSADGARLTLMFWFRQTTWAANDGIIGKGDATTGFRVAQVGATDQIIFQTMGASGFGQSAVGDFPLSEWHHVAWIYDGSQGSNATKLVCVKDGSSSLTLTFNGTIDASIPNSATGFTCGFDAVNSQFGNVDIANVKMWNTVLTLNDVWREYKSYFPVKKFPTADGLLLWLPFDDELKARDYSGGEWHGTVTDTPVQIASFREDYSLAGVLGRGRDYDAFRPRWRRGLSPRPGPLVPRFPNH